MRDLEIAKRSLCERGLTLSIVSGGQVILEAASRGISGFLRAIDEFRDKLEGASVADKVVGKAVALLCIYARVRAVYARVLSREARAMLEENSVCVEWEMLVESVLDADKAAACPFERLAAQIVDPGDAYDRLRSLQNSLRQCG